MNRSNIVSRPMDNGTVANSPLNGEYLLLRSQNSGHLVHYFFEAIDIRGLLQNA